MLVKGLHSTLKEPLNCILWNSFEVDWELNSTYQLQFTCYDDQSVSYSIIDSECSIFFDNQEYIVKQCLPDFSGGIETKQVVAIHVYNEVQRVRQYKVNTGTLTYSVSDVLSFYLSDNAMGFTYAVVGNFEKAQLTDLGNESGKDMLSKIISTWPDAVIFPDNKKITIYSLAAFTKNYGARIDYLRDTTEIKLTYDSTNIVNQVKVFGKTKESDNENSDVEEFYFSPHFVTDQESVDKWGLHQGEDISDERFTDSTAMDKYALTQLTSEPSLTIDATYSDTDKPIAGEQRRLELRKSGYVTNVQIVAYVWYPFDRTQPTQLTFNNTAKTILDYQKNNNERINRAILNQRKMNNKIENINQATENINKQMDYTWTEADVNEWYGH
ncbi:phage tail protein [Latilactobacillus curvatus]|uniref:phage tail protein n=1 Tax=Latilactobacillus curvatus TaxID=28038 RepID=UPI00223B9956|nr:phage tail protein [Latilactobacillus curvatus]